MNEIKKCILKGQHTSILNLSESIHKLLFQVDQGKIRINHCCYTPDGGTWLDFPNGGREAHYDMIDGDKREIIFDIRSSFGKLDRIEIVNCKLFKCAVFSYEEVPLDAYHSSD